jgi:hypothetical protein
MKVIASAIKYIAERINKRLSGDHIVISGAKLSE